MESSRPARARFWSSACERSEELGSGSRCVANERRSSAVGLLRAALSGPWHNLAVERVQILCILEGIMLGRRLTSRRLSGSGSGQNWRSIGASSVLINIGRLDAPRVGHPLRKDASGSMYIFTT